jgi:hypothetical protein
VHALPALRQSREGGAPARKNDRLKLPVFPPPGPVLNASGQPSVAIASISTRAPLGSADA